MEVHGGSHGHLQPMSVLTPLRELELHFLESLLASDLRVI